MKTSPIPLWKDEVPGYHTADPGYIPTLAPFLIPGKRPRPVAIVFPGGGYHSKAPHEAEPVALWLNAIGLSAFILDYRVFPYQHPYPLMDAKRAIKLVRSNADIYGIDTNRIAVLGFSAGGHLASTVGTHSSEINQLSDAVDRLSSRPNALILCYPVITFYKHRHIGCMEALIGDNPPDELRQSLSTELQVDRDTPTTFLFHTANDASVPVENSLLFAKALSRHNVPFELHIFPDGAHGVGLAQANPFLSIWTDLCSLWLKKIGFLPS